MLHASYSILYRSIGILSTVCIICIKPKHNKHKIMQSKIQNEGTSAKIRTQNTKHKTQPTPHYRPSRDGSFHKFSLIRHINTISVLHTFQETKWKVPTRRHMNKLMLKN